jgi:hypothetical protein
MTGRALRSLALVGAFSAGVGAASADGPSTYQTTCRHIEVAGKTLSAECRRNDGSFKQTQLPIAAIENHNGALRFTSMFKASTFQDTCTEIHVVGATLSARCRRIDGGLTRTSIQIPGIENLDGELRYR